MGNTIQNTPPAGARQQTTATDKTAAWQGVLDTAVNRMNETKGTLDHLGEGRIDTVKQKVKEDMEAFIQANPNASADDIRAEADKASKKHETNAFFQKMRDDNFFNKLMTRRKELLKDMWG